MGGHVFPAVVGGACAVIDLGVTVVDEIAGGLVEEWRGVVVRTGTKVDFPLWFPSIDNK